jgi:hypothetical protein
VAEARHGHGAQLDMPSLLALAAALGWASGFRLYAVVFLVGLMGATGWLALPPGLHMLQHPLVLIGERLHADGRIFRRQGALGRQRLGCRAHRHPRAGRGRCWLRACSAPTTPPWPWWPACWGARSRHLAGHQDDHARGGQYLARAVFQLGAVSFLEDGLVVAVVWLATQYPRGFWLCAGGDGVRVGLLLVVLFKFLRAVLRRCLCSFLALPASGRNV